MNIQGGRWIAGGECASLFEGTRRKWIRADHDATLPLLLWILVTFSPSPVNDLFRSMLAASQLMLPLLSGYMLHLLSQSRISEFHSFLERIKCEDLNNVYVKCAVKVEQSLMEGSYNHVWRMRGDIPMPEYAVFMDLLVSTIRYQPSFSPFCTNRFPTLSLTILHFYVYLPPTT